MTAPGQIITAARWDLPVWILERGRDNTLRLALYRDGAPVVPSVATVTVYPPSGDALVTNAAATTVSARSV